MATDSQFPDEALFILTSFKFGPESRPDVLEGHFEGRIPKIRNIYQAIEAKPKVLLIPLGTNDPEFLLLINSRHRRNLVISSNSKNYHSLTNSTSNTPVGQPAKVSITQPQRDLAAQEDISSAQLFDLG